MKSTRSGWPIAGVTLAGTAALLLAIVLFEFSGRDLISEALGPIAVVPDSADDAAGDALVPNDGNDSALPVIAPLDDDRVVAALAPLAPLSCRRDDPEDGKRAASDDALDAPLASYASPAQLAASGPLVVAADRPTIRCGGSVRGDRGRGPSASGAGLRVGAVPRRRAAGLVVAANLLRLGRAVGARAFRR